MKFFYSAEIILLLSLALCVGSGGLAVAGPPFLTDDPDPVPLHHWELYSFMTADRTDGADTFNGPALELNNGIAPNTQLHLIVPETYFSDNGMSAEGLGDIEAGVKYRLWIETRERPEVGVFPLLEIPTGDASKGLGNGRAWTKIPVWLEKNWGRWTSYGGGGYAYNPAPGELDYGFGGLLIQRTLSAALSLGGEVFVQGAQAKNDQSSGAGPSTGLHAPGERSSAIWNVGGAYNFTPDFSLLFSGGHSFQGDGNSVFYLALYRTWGPGAP